MLNENIIFYLFSIFLVISAFMVVVAQHPVLSLLFLVFSFIFSSIILFMLKWEFLGLLFFIVYVGAIAVLVLSAFISLISNRNYFKEILDLFLELFKQMRYIFYSKIIRIARSLISGYLALNHSFMIEKESLPKEVSRFLFFFGCILARLFFLFFNLTFDYYFVSIGFFLLLALIFSVIVLLLAHISFLYCINGKNIKANDFFSGLVSNAYPSVIKKLGKYLIFVRYMKKYYIFAPGTREVPIFKEEEIKKKKKFANKRVRKKLKKSRKNTGFFKFRNRKSKFTSSQFQRSYSTTTVKSVDDPFEFGIFKKFLIFDAEDYKNPPSYYRQPDAYVGLQPVSYQTMMENQQTSTTNVENSDSESKSTSSASDLTTEPTIEAGMSLDQIFERSKEAKLHATKAEEIRISHVFELTKIWPEYSVEQRNNIALHCGSEETYLKFLQNSDYIRQHGVEGFKELEPKPRYSGLFGKTIIKLPYVDQELNINFKALQEAVQETIPTIKTHLSNAGPIIKVAGLTGVLIGGVMVYYTPKIVERINVEIVEPINSNTNIQNTRLNSIGEVDPYGENELGSPKLDFSKLPAWKRQLLQRHLGN
jgi:NADH:ubiquinone oxidoreductase subunit 6 (subunit J)